MKHIKYYKKQHKQCKKQWHVALLITALMSGSAYSGSAQSPSMMTDEAIMHHHMLQADEAMPMMNHHNMKEQGSMVTHHKMEVNDSSRATHHMMKDEIQAMQSSHMMGVESHTMNGHHMMEVGSSTMKGHHMMRHGVDDIVAIKEVKQASRALPIPPLMKGTVDESGRTVYTVTAQAGESAIKDGAKTATYGYNGSLLGPALYMEQGDMVRIHLENNLPEDTTFHWHGLVVRSDVDGGPHHPIKANGGTGMVDFTVHQGAATAWYHPHNMGSTASQVYKGLAGFIIIHDPNQDALGLPQTYGIDDIPVVLQDRNFTEDNQWDYTKDYDADGVYGDTLVVNGTINPYFEVNRKLVRVRLLNGSNARNYTVALSDGSSFTKIGVDGSLLNTPVARHKVTLVPGERVELLLDFSKYEDELPSLVTQDKTVSVLKFKRGAELDTMPNSSLPTWYMGYPTYAAVQDKNEVVGNKQHGDTNTAQVNSVTNNAMHMNSMAGNATHVKVEDKDTALVHKADKDIVMAGMAEDVTINGKKFSMDRIDLTSQLGSTEIWDITNADHGMMGMIHPFHMHGVQFEVLTRNGKPVSTSEQGLKDTILVSPGETVRIKVKFTEPGIFMVHCHILEHEENGMMMQLEVK